MNNLPTPAWVYPDSVEIPTTLRSEIGGSDLFLQILVRRGLTDPQKARAFLDPDVYQPNPGTSLPGMEKAISRILSALNSREKIGVWGDFDVDGQTSTAILVGGLRILGANVIYHIPVRGPESHGISISYLEDFLATGIDLLITCDTGISANDAVDHAVSKGVDVIITDHHSLPGVLPSAFSLINPHFLRSDHPLKTLSGSGVAYKVIESLFSAAGHAGEEIQFSDLAALGLIADVAILKNDARYIVQKGLTRMRQHPRLCLQSILKENRSSSEDVDENVISYLLAPRLNAVGRLADANPMVEFLLSDEPVFIATTTNQIEGFNSQRKILCDQVFKSAQSMLEQEPRLLEKPIIFLGHPEWPNGVVGIVASRLVEIFHRPAILYNASDPRQLKGSARSVDGIDIIAVINEHANLLNSCGGHPMAAGLAFTTENLESLKQGISQSVAKMAAESNFQPTIEIDLPVKLNNLDFGLIAELSQLAPFGPGNPPILFSANQLEIESSSVMGKSKEHERLVLQDVDGKLYKSIWWQSIGFSHPVSRFELAFHASLKKFMGVIDVQLEWQDYRDTSESIEPTKLRQVNSKRQNIDLRASLDSVNDLKKITTEGDVLVYAEGSEEYVFETTQRFGVRPCKTLVILSTPPSLEVLHHIISESNPIKVYWICIDPKENLMPDLLKSAGRMIKTCLLGDQTLSLDMLAAICASTTTLARMILRWYEARGDIVISPINEREVMVEPANAKSNTPAQQQLIDQITTAHAEVTAFRKYIRKTSSIEFLLPEIKSKRM